LYIPDIDSWDPVKDRIHKLLKENDYALLDGTFYSGAELPGRDMKLVPHPTIQNSMAFLKSLGVLKSQIYFIHLNHTNVLLDDSSSEAREFSSTPFHVAAEWQEFPL
jgi:pyrroloquinoline quinone biosynthesis protein B